MFSCYYLLPSRLRVSSIGILALACLLDTDVAFAQYQARACIESYLATLKRGDQTLGIAAADAEKIIQDVANSIGLTSSIKMVPCRFGKVEATTIQVGTPDVDEGEYITYNPDWIREVIGSDNVQIVAVLGHEFGHFLNRHFSVNRALSVQEKETQADHFAGCAVARMGGKWSALEDLLSRLRRDQDQLYPNRLKSLSAASNGFKACGGSFQPKLVYQNPSPPAELKNGAGNLCSTIKALTNLADQGFEPVRYGNLDGDQWKANFKFDGFDRCFINKYLFLSYGCFSSAASTKKSQSQFAAKLIRDAQSCLGPTWNRRDTSSDKLSLRSSLESKFISINVSEMPTLDDDRKKSYYVALSIANMDVKADGTEAVKFSPPAVMKAEKPTGYCEQLNEVAANARTGFAQLLGAKTGSSYLSKSQLNGWSRCRIATLGSGSAAPRYHTCELPSLQDEASANEFVKDMSEDLKSCLGGAWSFRQRKDMDGMQRIEFVSAKDATEVEVRLSEDDGLWRVKLDVNQPE